MISIGESGETFLIMGSHPRSKTAHKKNLIAKSSGCRVSSMLAVKNLAKEQLLHSPALESNSAVSWQSREISSRHLNCQLIGKAIQLNCITISAPMCTEDSQWWWPIGIPDLEYLIITMSRHSKTSIIIRYSVLRGPKKMAHTHMHTRFLKAHKSSFFPDLYRIFLQHQFFQLYIRTLIFYFLYFTVFIFSCFFLSVFHFCEYSYVWWANRCILC